ncbi:hypothetical protein ACE3MZ_02455 [Paenibacillus sp. WLX1005]|uniref:hypothetical protein n=1 Tax=Paenibacillus sp. WLX1005 TaxID=3243766 RepID=UPI0039844CA2
MNSKSVLSLLCSLLLLAVLLPAMPQNAHAEVYSADEVFESEADVYEYLEDFRTVVDPELLDAYDDYVAYFKVTNKATAYGEIGLSTYNENTAFTQATRKQAYKNIKTIAIPNYTKFINMIKKAKPQQPELIALHEKFLKGANIQLEGFKLFANYLNTATPTAKQKYTINTKIKLATKIITQYNQSIYKYVDQFSLE